MKFLFLLISTIFIYQNLSSQLDNNLVLKLDSMIVEDQKWRSLLMQNTNEKIDTIPLSKIEKNLLHTDSINFTVIKEIFNTYGFLGYDQVGEKGSHSFWLLVQHADNHPEFQEKVLKKMKIEALKDNANFKNYAYLLDRVKVNTNELQVFGTQMTLNSDSSSYEPLPVVDPKNLNKRRKEIKLPTIEYYIKMMNKFYFGSLKN